MKGNVPPPHGALSTSQVVLIKDAIGHNRRAYVLVNNRLEGNAPLTVQALTDLIREEPMGRLEDSDLTIQVF